MGEEIFVVVLDDDRTADPVITLHRSRVGADRRIEEIKATYHRSFGLHVRWLDREYDPERDRGWLFCTIPDSHAKLSARIERVILRD